MSPFISPGELKARLSDSNLRIVDCRFNLLEPDAGRLAWEAGRIPGARYAHLDDDLAGEISAATGRHPLPDKGDLCGWLGRQGVHEDNTVVVYDDAGGAIAARLWWLLRWLGHEECAILSGGFQAWVSAGYATVDDDPVDPAPCRYTARHSDWETLSTAEVLQWLSAGSGSRLLDARAGGRFRGEQEPIDPVAGHIPGSRNVPFETLQDEGQLILGPPAVRAVLERALGGDTAAPWAVMCGSGVTACYLAAAAEHAGLPRPALYVGSFSEWIRDSRRPVASN